MSGNNPHRLAALLRRLGGRQNRSESHLPDISTGPEQLGGEHMVHIATFAVHLYSLLAFQLSQTPSPQPNRRIKDKFKELFTKKSKGTSRTNSLVLPAENIHPTEVCTDCVFEVSPITNPTGQPAFEFGPLRHRDRSSGSSPIRYPPQGNPVRSNQCARSCNRGRSSSRCK